MRTLTVHTADELAQRWKRQAFDLDQRAHRHADDSIGRMLTALDAEKAQVFRVCATELQAIVAASMEMEAAHHGDPEPDNDVAEGNVWPRIGDPFAQTVVEVVGGGADAEPEMETEIVSDPNALMEWSQGRRP
jgi:hypothetical protein